MRIFMLLAVIFVAVVGISVIMFNIIKFFSSLRNSKSRLYREVNNIRTRSEELMKQLIPLNSEEIGELSYQIITNKKIKGLKTKTITTIYNEPLLTFTSRIDKNSGIGYAVYYANEKEFSFIHLNELIEVFVNERPFGRLKKDGSLRDANNKVIAYISNEGGSKAIITNEKELGKINKHINGSMLERVFFYKAELNKVEEEILLAMTLPEITKNFNSN